MRRIWIWSGLLAAVMVVGNASAISTDGQWNDWFSFRGIDDRDWDQNAASGSLRNSDFRFANDSDYDADGGQNYDIEQIFYYYEDIDPNTHSGGTLHIGMVTGYEPTNRWYESGDMFVDLGANGTFNLAVATGTESSRYGTTWYNDLANGGWDQSSDGVTIASHSASNPYRILENQGGVIEYGGPSDPLGLTTLIDWDRKVGPGKKHNFLEMAIQLDGGMESLLTGGIGLHWTMQCGNDAIDVVDHDPLTPFEPTPPQAPIPEPATMVILGMGVLGAALRSRQGTC